MRSDEMKTGVERAAHRSLLKALGLTDSDMQKPFIGIANSYTTLVPGHIHLKQLGEALHKESQPQVGLHSNSTPSLSATD
jgi:dihydroxy-acid dehydratase